MIFVGWGNKAIPLVEMGTYSCPRCGLARPFRAVLTYSYFRLYWIFGMVTGRRYLCACTICGQGSVIDRSQIPFVPEHDPIPFMQQWGLALFLGAIALVVAIVMIAVK
jgi:hypothetical protein